MEVKIVYFILCMIVGTIASKKKRSGLGWFFIAFLISPILAGIIVLCLKKLGKTCPKCAEMVNFEASVCKHCGFDKFYEPEPTPELSDTICSKCETPLRKGYSICNNCNYVNV
jgi:RNA polymerase subunit RPABC4/transcription elongation factor Spt4